MIEIIERGGGLCAYVRNIDYENYNLQCDDIFPAVQNSDCIDDNQITWLHLCNRSGSNVVDYYVACCYYPPKLVYSTNKFIVTLSDQLEYIIANHPHSFIFVMDDLNMLNTGFLCNDFGLEPICMAPTHGNNLIDKIVVNLCHVYATNVHVSILKTKHKLVHIFPVGSKQINNTNSRAKITSYDTSAHNIDKLRFVLGTYNWQCIYDETKNVDIAYIMFLNAVRNCITKCIPTRTVGCSQKDPDFVTPFIKDLLNKRKKLRKSGRVREANLLANKINNLICESRKRRLSRVSEASTRKLWAAVKPNKHKIDWASNIFIMLMLPMSYLLILQMILTTIWSMLMH